MVAQVLGLLDRGVDEILVDNAIGRKFQVLDQLLCSAVLRLYTLTDAVNCFKLDNRFLSVPFLKARPFLGLASDR